MISKEKYEEMRHGVLEIIKMLQKQYDDDDVRGIHCVVLTNDKNIYMVGCELPDQNGHEMVGILESAKLTLLKETDREDL